MRNLPLDYLEDDKFKKMFDWRLLISNNNFMHFNLLVTCLLCPHYMCNEHDTFKSMNTINNNTRCSIILNSKVT